jgi:hypothetical protein
MKHAKLLSATAMAAAVSLSTVGQGVAEVRHGGGGNRGGGGSHNMNRNTNVNRNANVNVNRNANVNVNRNAHWNGGNYGNYHGGWNRSYTWLPGGAIAAGAAIGFVAAGTAVAWAPPAPYPGLCWYYTDASQRNGFWDSCP